MREWWRLLVLVLVVGVVRPAGAQVAVGVTGGVILSDLSGDAPPKASFGTRPGFAVGIIGELEVAEDVIVSLQPMYLQRGTKIAFEVEGEEEPRDSLDLRLDYLTIPILLKVVTGSGRTYVTGGLDLGFLLDATLTATNEKLNLSDTLKSIDLAAEFGFGVVFPIGRPRLTVEARYLQSILNIAKPEENPEAVSLPLRFRSSGFQFLAGFLIPFGNL